MLPLRALDNNGSGFMSDIAAAFDYAGDLGIRIVNASLGGGYASILGTVVASHPDTLYVVAAGNDNADNDNAATASYPCALPEPNVLCVGATDPTDSRASFSNFGRTSVDLSAPGVAILSAWHSSANAYRLLSGTSMATPHVAGAAALALAATPTATTSQLKWALTSSVDVKSALATASVDQGPPERRRRRRRDHRPGPAGGPDARADRHAGADRSRPRPPRRSPHAGHPRADADAARRPPVIVTPPPAADPIITTPVAAQAPSLFNVKVGGSLARRAGKLKVTYSLSDTAVVRFTVTRQGQERHRLDAPQRQGRQRRHPHAQAAQRQDAEGRRLHPLGRDQREREELRRDPRPLSSFFGSGNGDTWSAAATANARGSSLAARSMNS